MNGPNKMSFKEKVVQKIKRNKQLFLGIGIGASSVLISTWIKNLFSSYDDVDVTEEMEVVCETLEDGTQNWNF